MGLNAHTSYSIATRMMNITTIVKMIGMLNAMEIGAKYVVNVPLVIHVINALISGKSILFIIIQIIQN
jgi:hypothetical protein